MANMYRRNVFTVRCGYFITFIYCSVNHSSSEAVVPSMISAHVHNHDIRLFERTLRN